MVGYTSASAHTRSSHCDKLAWDDKQASLINHSSLLKVDLEMLMFSEICLVVPSMLPPF